MLVTVLVIGKLFDLGANEDFIKRLLMAVGTACPVDELVEIAGVMARDLEYEIDNDAYAVFKEYIEKRMKLPYFSNARTVRNAMDRARMNSAIRTFDKYAIEGANGGVCTVDDLKRITKEDFQVLVDDIDNADTDKRIFA